MTCEEKLLTRKKPRGKKVWRGLGEVLQVRTLASSAGHWRQRCLPALQAARATRMRGNSEEVWGLVLDYPLAGCVRSRQVLPFSGHQNLSLQTEKFWDQARGIPKTVPQIALYIWKRVNQLRHWDFLTPPPAPSTPPYAFPSLCNTLANTLASPLP